MRHYRSHSLSSIFSSSAVVAVGDRYQIRSFISTFFGVKKSFSNQNEGRGRNSSTTSDNEGTTQQSKLSNAGEVERQRQSPRFSPPHASSGPMPSSSSTAAATSSATSNPQQTGGAGKWVSPMSPEVYATSSCVAASFPRSVDEAKGAFVGNFPAQGAKLQASHFYNKVPFLRPSATLAEASEFMCLYDVGCVPVLEFISEPTAAATATAAADSTDNQQRGGDNSKAVALVMGMLSERDLARWLCKCSPTPQDPSSQEKGTAATTTANNNIGEGGGCDNTQAESCSSSSSLASSSSSAQFFSPHTVRVEDIMTRNVIFCTDETTLDEAMALMDKHNFRHLPVMSSRRRGKGTVRQSSSSSPSSDIHERDLVGLLSMRDIMHQHVRGKGKGHVDEFMSWVLKMSS